MHGSARALSKNLLTITGKTILELGCGQSESVPYILEQCAAAYTGIDFSMRAIAGFVLRVDIWKINTRAR